LNKHALILPKVLRHKVRKEFYFLILVFLLCHNSRAQIVDIDNLGKGKAFNVTGGVSANSVFYSTNKETSRLPFTYFLQGNLNFSFFELAIPLSYSFSNQGSNLSYQLPFKFNRLSLQPKYKWIQGYVGDVSMSFSPYTLNGHQFTGVGVELKPQGGFEFSAMSGRLLRATALDDNPQTIPSFERNGYGSKLMYKNNKFSIGLIGFYAKDKESSIEIIDPNEELTPKENLVVSIESSVSLVENLEVKVNYSYSVVNQDLNALEIKEQNGVAGRLVKNKISTDVYEAVKASMNYTFGKSSLGVDFEQIQPGYQTFGAYYFNNDFENITANLSTVIFDKITLSFNGGYQRDDLNNTKETATLRRVAAFNTSIVFSEKLNLNASYSNFSTFTNTRLNQFDILNDDNLLDNMADQFNYIQLSQNANLSMNYILSQKETLQQNMSFNYALAGVSDEQNGVVRIGGASTFHNLNANYQLSFPKKKLNFITALNATLNTIGDEDTITWGPSINANGKIFKDKITSALIVSYSSNKSQEKSSAITSIRLNASFQLKNKNNFSLNLIQLFKSIQAADMSRELTFTFGYSYAF